MPVGLIRYRDERDQHAAITRRDLARLLAPVVPEMFADVFNAGKHPDDAALKPLGQGYDIVGSDSGAFNVDDLTIVVSMDPGPDGRHEARGDELKQGLAARLLDFIAEQRPEVRRFVKTLQVDVRFQPMSGLVIRVAERKVLASWGGADLPNHTIPTAS